MVKQWLDKHIWSHMPNDSEWWCKGFIVATALWWLVYLWFKVIFK